MAFRKRTLRTMSPTARKVARLTGELESVARRFKNLVPDLQTLDFESSALKSAKESNLGQLIEADRQGRLAEARIIHGHLLNFARTDEVKLIDCFILNDIKQLEAENEIAG